MSYIPTEWKTGDVVTAEKFNHLEQGVAGAGSNEAVFFYLYRYKDEQTGEAVVEFEGEPQPTINDMVEAMSQNKRIFISLSDTIIDWNFQTYELFYTKEQEYFTVEIEKSEVGNILENSCSKSTMEFILYFDPDVQEYQFNLNVYIDIIGPVWLSGYMRDSAVIINFEPLIYILENEIDFNDIQIRLEQDQSVETYRLSYADSSFSLFKCRISDENSDSEGQYPIHKIITCTYDGNEWQAQYIERPFRDGA